MLNSKIIGLIGLILFITDYYFITGWQWTADNNAYFSAGGGAVQLTLIAFLLTIIYIYYFGKFVALSYRKFKKSS